MRRAATRCLSLSLSGPLSVPPLSLYLSLTLSLSVSLSLSLSLSLSISISLSISLARFDVFHVLELLTQRRDALPLRVAARRVARRGATRVRHYDSMLLAFRARA